MSYKKSIILIVILVIVIIGVVVAVMTRQKPEVSILPVVEKSDRFPDIAANNWQTYRNEQYGFEFKYPNSDGWKLQVNKGFNGSLIVTLLNVADDRPVILSVALTISPDISPNQEVSYWTEQEASSASFETNQLRGKRIFVNDSATQGQTKSEIYIFSRHESPPSYSFGIFGMRPNVDEKFLNDFRQVVSTFEFIDTSAQWQTYRNEQYGFEIRYPADWLADERAMRGVPGEPPYFSATLLLGKPGPNYPINPPGDLSLIITTLNSQSNCLEQFISQEEFSGLLGEQYRKCYTQDPGGKKYWVETKSQEFLFRFVCRIDLSFNEQGCDQILSSFRFLD